MKALWRRWVAACAAPEDLRPLALLRILLPLCVLADLLAVARADLLGALFVLPSDGGLSASVGEYWRAGFLGPDAGLVLVGLLAMCMVLVSLGLVTRPAALLGVLVYAQLGNLYPPGDRAVDRLVRTVLLLLIFSQSHRCWSLGQRMWGRASQYKAPRWLPQIIRLLLVIVYLSAGINKLGAGWFTLSGPPELWTILADPGAGTLDPDGPGRRLWPLFRVAGMGAVVFELLSPLIFTRLAPIWALGGLALHLGIAFTMKLGIFSWGMLALYPLLFAPWLGRLWELPPPRR